MTHLNIWRFIMAYIYLTLPLQLGLATIGIYFLETKVKGLIERIRGNYGKGNYRRVR